MSLDFTTLAKLARLWDASPMPKGLGMYLPLTVAGEDWILVVFNQNRDKCGSVPNDQKSKDWLTQHNFRVGGWFRVPMSFQERPTWHSLWFLESPFNAEAEIRRLLTDVTWQTNPLTGLQIASDARAVWQWCDTVGSGRQPTIIQTDDEIREAATYTSSAIRRAKEYYSAAERSSVDVSPVLYYYGALHLAKAVASSLEGRVGFEGDLDRKGRGTGHGLRYDAGSQSIKVKTTGDFPAFYRTAIGPDGFCASKPQLPLLDLLRVTVHDAFRRGYGLRFGQALPNRFGRDNIAHVADISRCPAGITYYDGRNELFEYLVELPIIAAELMVLYGMSQVARYQPVVWTEEMLGRSGPNGYLYQVALDTIPDSFASRVSRLLESRLR